MLRREGARSRFGKPCRRCRKAAWWLTCPRSHPCSWLSSFLRDSCWVGFPVITTLLMPPAQCGRLGFMGGGRGSDARCSLAFVTAAMQLLCVEQAGDWTGGVAQGAGGHPEATNTGHVRPAETPCGKAGTVPGVSDGMGSKLRLVLRTQAGPRRAGDCPLALQTWARQGLHPLTELRVSPQPEQLRPPSGFWHLPEPGP